MTRDDYVIVCGDLGLRKTIIQKNGGSNGFTLLFVDVNHENFNRLYSDEFDIVDYYGGKAHKIRENIYHLMRGYIFDLCSKKFFAFAGARSHDIKNGILKKKKIIRAKELLWMTITGERSAVSCYA